jgi:hypothetical protein
MGVKTITSKLIGVVFLLVIASSSVGYGYYRYQLDNTVTKLEITFDKVELKEFRLVPSPEANLTLIYVANNVNNTEFRISLDGELYYGSHYITPLTVEDARIRANGLSTFKMDVTITGSILNTIDPESKNEYSIQGELVATTRLFGLIPLSVTKSLSDYQ